MAPQDLPVIGAIVRCGYVLAIVAALFILHALWWDWISRRREGRIPRCPRCRYNMSGLSSLRCPECGCISKSESKLHRSRRYWGRAIAGLPVLLLAILSCQARTFVSDAWIPRLPAIILITIIDDPVAMQQRPTTQPEPPPTLNEKLRLEAWSRYGSHQLSLSRRRQLTAKQFTDGRDPLIVGTRPHWPASAPVYVAIQRAFRGVHPRCARVTPNVRDAERFELAENYRWCRLWGPYRPERSPEGEHVLFCLGTPAVGATGITLDVSIDELGDQLWSGAVHVPIQIGGTVDDIIEPSTKPSVDSLIREQLGNRLGLSDDGFWLMANPRTTAGLDGITVAVDVDFMFSAASVAHAEMIWTYHAGPPCDDANETCDVWVMLKGDTERLRAADRSDARWQVQIRGNGELALRDFTAAKYWPGEITIPLSALHRL